MKKLTKKMFVASTTAAIFAVAGMEVKAQEYATLDWAPRSVADIKADAEKTAASQTYVVQYGDTLSTIAEATGVDINVLAQINQISNLDLIFPGTVLTLNFDGQNQVSSVAVVSHAEEAPVSEIAVPTTEAPVSEAAPVVETPEVTTEVPVTEDVTEPTTEAPVTEAPATEAVVEAPAVEEAPVETTEAPAPVVETPEVTTEAPVAEEVTEASTEAEAVVAQTLAAPVEEAPAAPVEEVVTETPAVEVQEAPAPAVANNITINTNGMQPQAATFANAVANEFGITNIGGYREGADAQDHGQGLAVDVMVEPYSAQGDAVAQYAIDNMAANNISYVIYKQMFYAPVDNIYGPAYTWNPMPDRGSITQNHFDHVHVSFNG